MLVEFRVENFRSIRDEQVVSFEVARLGTDPDRPGRDAGSGKPLLTSLAIYGANASGKSNLLAAFNWMRHAVRGSVTRWDPDGGVPLSPFAWGEHANGRSFFEVILVLEKRRYRYGFEADAERVTEEWLTESSGGHEKPLFERDGLDIKIPNDAPRSALTVKQVTRPNSLFLSTAATLGYEPTRLVSQWFGVTRVHQSDLRWASEPPPTERAIMRLLPSIEVHQLGLFDAPPVPVPIALKHFLQAADVGIVDVRFVDQPAGADSGTARSRMSTGRRIELGHRHGDRTEWLPLSQESNGTRRMIDLAPTVLETLESGGLLVADELEANLHPLLAARLVELFNSHASNPRNAQLMFATHDTNLLGTLPSGPSLRRDQVWFCEKDDTGATKVYSLTDFHPRNAENLERGYLQGRYGAIPFLGGFPDVDVPSEAGHAA